MKNSARYLTVLACVMLAVTLVGCPKKAVKTEWVPPVAPDTTTQQVPPPKPELELSTIYFDFDKSDIRASEVQKLSDNAEQIKKNPSVSVTIEGHCCPIGTSEYNMALGQRRAEAAKAYLVKLGVPASQLSTVSYGEERLVTTNESQYHLNRRCEFKTQ